MRTECQQRRDAGRSVDRCRARAAVYQDVCGGAASWRIAVRAADGACVPAVTVVEGHKAETMGRLSPCLVVASTRCAPTASHAYVPQVAFAEDGLDNGCVLSGCMALHCVRGDGTLDVGDPAFSSRAPCTGTHSLGSSAWRCSSRQRCHSSVRAQVEGTKSSCVTTHLHHRQRLHQRRRPHRMAWVSVA